MTSEAEEFFPLPRHLLGDGVLFLLKVADDSMMNAAIADGDWVIVRQQAKAEDGATVAVMLCGDATVRVLERIDGRLWLMPRNPDYNPVL